MRLIIEKDYDSVCRWAAQYIMNRINAAPSFVLGLPTGSSPLGVYRELSAYNREGKISFKKVTTFNMDEYIGLPADHPQSYHYFMEENFFKHIDIDRNNVHILNGIADDPVAECRAYEDAILKAGGIDLFLGGMGADGHLAFNEPGSSLSSRTRIKTLTPGTRIANARFFGDDMEQVPSTALTVGIGTVMDAREVLVLVSGYAKARALQAAVEEGLNHIWPLSCLQMHPRAIIVCDEEATDELRVGTVRYFKETESARLKAAGLSPLHGNPVLIQPKRPGAISHFYILFPDFLINL